MKFDPANIENRIRLAVYLLESDRFQDTIDILKKVEDRLDTYPKLNYYFSKAYFYKGDTKKAIDYAELEVKYNPFDEWGYVMLGEIYTRTKKYRLAINNLEEALKRNRNSVDALLAVAYIKYLQNFLPEALSLYKRVAKESPNNATARRQIGFIYKSMGQGALAIDSFRVYLDLAPEAQDRREIQELMKELAR
jgi:cytochrome c-type biogenesis protein CcmH/NrfG